MEKSREMTLREFVDTLPKGHLARKQYRNLLKIEKVWIAYEHAGVDNWDDGGMVSEFLESEDYKIDFEA